MDTVNIWSIIVASIVAFAISALWYSPVLFGKEWMALSKIDAKDVANAKASGMTWLYVWQLVITFVTFTVMAFAIAALGANGRDGAMIGFLAWVGFILPTGLSGLLWEKKPLKLILITTVGVLVNLVIGGAIIGAWN